MDKIICECCKEDTSDYLNYLLESEAKRIIVCDYCFQEIATLIKVDGKWIERIILDGMEFVRV
jgi:hypothetical protein